MLMLENVFNIINESGLDYCIQNKYEMMPEEIPSDIDIIYKGANESFLDSLASKIANETGLLITQKIVGSYNQFAYMFSYSSLNSKFQLQLDFNNAIMGKEAPFVMMADQLLKDKIKYKCFYIPESYQEIKYIWIRRTLKKDFDSTHLIKIKSLFCQNEKTYYLKLQDDFGYQLAEIMLNIIKESDTDAFYNNYELFLAAVKKLSHENQKGNFLKLKRAWCIITKKVPKRYLHKCGMSVAFLAPDGTGKSTVINRISETCGGSFHGVEVKYFRPRLFSNLGHYNIVNPREEASTNDDPHGKVSDNPLKSFIRFMFYNVDFILGTLIKINKLKIKNKLVIFDRYYNDYYADMKRYQYSLPVWIPKAFSWIIPKPDLTIVLDAESNIIQSRKKELSLEEIDRQRYIFRKLATKRKTVLVDASRDIEQVVEDVTKLILINKAKQTAKIIKNAKTTAESVIYE